ncbi:MAG: Unknown protein [uncultured Sulfurovum sp.]|uniref:Hemerythrin-like domain-containing protein n=1 Tax=uncultured Sulfurovum sp. TaxID=269237 RepID=A0A6S6TS37_9BACT|nr:MAG: Unknown protein [uncultured Sulfurovum sp.]
MFFGLFTPKKKSRIPLFDAKLIKKFHHDHIKLVKSIGDINKALEQGNSHKVKKLLLRLRMEILGHFMEEDIKLYWYLKDYYKDEENANSLVKTFDTSIKMIQKDVIKFLDYYTQDYVPLDMEFQQKFDMMVSKLASRIESEESNLYPLYQK